MFKRKSYDLYACTFGVGQLYADSFVGLLSVPTLKDIETL